MREHEIRWPALITLATFISLAQLASETSGLWFGLPARPDWLWVLAFCSALHTAPASALTAFAVCGLARDLLLGPKLGAGAVAYALVGWLALSLRLLAAGPNALAAAILTGSAAFIAALVRHALDYGCLAPGFLGSILFAALADGLLTAVVCLPLGPILNWRPLRTWREHDGH